jgi:hypothetical protein
MQFYHLAIGARFEFRGRQYLKRALSMARDSDWQHLSGWGGSHPDRRTAVVV